MEQNMDDSSGEQSMSQSNNMTKSESHKSYNNNNHRGVVSGSDLWTDGLICAFEYVRGLRRSMKSKCTSKLLSRVGGERSETPVLSEVPSPRLEGNQLFELKGNQNATSDEYRDNSQANHLGQYHTMERYEDGHWVSIGWARISKLVQMVQTDAQWATQQLELMDDDEDLTVADLAAPYWERPVGPVWWCHVTAGHPAIQSWLNNSKWLHPAISLALRDESRLISERMKYLLYEVPVRVTRGLLFELLGQSAGDPFADEDDIPIVVHLWHAQNFLITALHIKGRVSRVNVLGIVGC